MMRNQWVTWIVVGWWLSGGGVYGKWGVLGMVGFIVKIERPRMDGDDGK